MRLFISTYVLLILLQCATLYAEDALVLLSTDIVPAELREMSPRFVVPQRLLKKLRDTPQDDSRTASVIRRLQRYVRVAISGSSITLDSLRSIKGITSVWVPQTYHLHRVNVEEPISNDSLSANQYALGIIGAREAWSYASGKGVLVGIIDTGIDWDHEDLRDALAVSVKEDLNGNGRFEAWSHDEERMGVTGDLNGIDDDANGMIDDVIGADFVDQEFRNLGDDRLYDPVPFDEHGHGTLVAGVIAATKDNGKGIAGLAYGAKLRAIRAFDATGSAEEDDIAAALVYAAANGVQIINMSFGEGVQSPLTQDATEFAVLQGCVLVASAGNSGMLSTQYPASFTGVIVAAATTSRDMRAPFSSTGPVLSLSAPGQAIITTSVNSRYRTVSGTSFSAPYVAAAAALLLERFPDMSADEIRGTLMATSKDLGDIGWDPLYGSGRLRADAAVVAAGKSRIAIRKPRNEEEFDPQGTKSIDVWGSNHTVSFLRSELSIGTGANPAQWTTISTSQNSVVDGLIGSVPSKGLPKGLSTLRVRSYGTDGRHHDCHVRIRIVDADSCTITSAEHITAWLAERKTDVVTLRTSRPTSCSVTTSNAPFIDIASTPKVYGTLHSVVLPDTSAYGTTMKSVRVVASPIVGRSSEIQVKLPQDAVMAAPTTVLDTVLRAPWAGYVLNDVRDIYRDGSQCFAMNDLSDGGFGRTVIVQFTNGRWVLRDSLNDVYIPRAITDVNGNGRYELLCHVIGKTVLFEQQSPTSSIFSQVLFADSTNVVNAAGAADIDGDGREEIFSLADNACYVFTCKDNTFSILGIAKNGSKPSPGNATNRVDEISVAAADFNGNGKMEIAFADTDGDLVVHEWNGSSFDELFVYESQGAGGSGFVATGDIDADGRNEILFGVPDSLDPNSAGEYGRSVWTYSLFTYRSDSGYVRSWQDHVAGVRYGIGYRNGVAMNNVDAVPGDELIISAFPRMYIFGRDTSSAIVPKAFIDNVATPRVLTYDIDGDGRTELGFGTTIRDVGAMAGFSFVRMRTAQNLHAPSALRAYHERSTDSFGSARLTWFPVPGATSYEVVRRRGTRDSTVIQTVGTDHRYVLQGLADTLISFVVRAVQSGRADSMGLPSNRVVVDARPSMFGLELKRTSVYRNELVGGMVLQILSTVPIDGGRISLPRQILSSANSTDTLGRARYARIVGSNALQLVFPGLIIADDSLVLHCTLPVSRDMSIGTTFVIRILDDPEPGSQKQTFTLSGVSAISAQEVRVRFSHAVDTSALNVASYSIRPLVQITSAVRVDSSTISLMIDPSTPLQARGITYAVTARSITFDTTHVIVEGAGSTLTFSVFGSGEQDVYAYPQPLRLQSHDELVFAGLPPIAEIEVFNSVLHPVALLSSIDGNGGVRWDLRDVNDQRVLPGVYFYIVTAKAQDGSVDVWPMKKLLIQR